jgi:hypothetical protein
MTLVRTTALMLAAMTLCASEQTEAQIHWTLPSAYPGDNFHSENLAAFAKDVAELQTMIVIEREGYSSADSGIAPYVAIASGSARRNLIIHLHPLAPPSRPACP